ncbi:hypothetical protein PR202_ga09865 [Eleusine coracana subsp. coracana]|uniref:Myb/SANT-like DNA-binding domain-containing protein n=1 Tax=Eleusine coracana subsp. coracana TaxID=191504 RepID=A0AAV5C5G0_ELECO|nr:hypothetical protein QOZ80_1AG0031270 [Eleusine coracana subsp. coracana]GJM93318.1 hypothetical protein PR202_ga09865 [Eleusine coracana subsp. coracana]
MGDDAPSPSPSRSLSSSSGVSRSPSSPRTKRRRTDRYALGFEFAPRLAAYEVPSSPERIPSPEDPPQRAAPEWTEGSTFVLLDAWGDRFVHSGRRGIRAEEWLEVARLAAAADGRPVGYFSESQCRNRIDTLRKKFKKEKERLRMAERRSRPTTSKWVYFDKLMSILYPPPPPPSSLPDTQPSPSLPLPPPLLLPHVVTRRRDTRPSPRLSWGRDAPERMLGGGGDIGPRDSRMDVVLGGEQKFEAAPQSPNGFAVFTKSMQKFGDVIQRLESRKRQHIVEVEQMRKDFHRDLDAKWREILERAQAEIACLEDEDEDEEEDGDGGDGDKRLEYVGGQGRNNGTMDTSHRT